MASNSENLLQSAISAVERAFARLDAVTDIALDERAQALSGREAMQTELSHGWQLHSARLEASFADAQAENEGLRQENLRLSRQLEKLQSEHLALQQTAGHTLGRLDASVKQLDLILEH